MPATCLVPDEANLLQVDIKVVDNLVQTIHNPRWLGKPATLLLQWVLRIFFVNVAVPHNSKGSGAQCLNNHLPQEQTHTHTHTYKNKLINPYARTHKQNETINESKNASYYQRARAWHTASVIFNPPPDQSKNSS